jgi:hypothetical protein
MMTTSKLLIGTAVVGLSIVTISAWQNRPCDNHCRADKVQEFQQQMLKCTAQVGGNFQDVREAAKCVEKLTAQIERATQK